VPLRFTPGYCPTAFQAVREAGGRSLTGLIQPDTGEAVVFQPGGLEENSRGQSEAAPPETEARGNSTPAGVPELSDIEPDMFIEEVAFHHFISLICEYDLKT